MNFETPEFIWSICLNGKMQKDSKIMENVCLFVCFLSKGIFHSEIFLNHANFYSKIMGLNKEIP